MYHSYGFTVLTHIILALDKKSEEGSEKKAKSQSNKSPGSKTSQVAGETATVHYEKRRPNFVCREQRPPQWDEILFNLVRPCIKPICQMVR